MLSIWSAGCSSGEEPYTLSPSISRIFGSQASQWDTRILATIFPSKRSLQGPRGLYQMPADMSRCMGTPVLSKTGLQGLYQVAPPFCNNVIFRPFNLMDPIHFPH